MIQRIQTVYLLIVVVLTSLVISFPIMKTTVVNLDGSYVFGRVTVGAYIIGKMSLFSVWPLLVLCISNILLSLVAISQFKKRVLQMRLCVFNILLIVGFYAMLAWYYWILKGEFSADKFAFNWTVVLPAINIILIYLSIRAIGRDEALVRATERLR